MKMTRYTERQIFAILRQAEGGVPVAGGRWPMAGGRWPVAGGRWPSFAVNMA